MRQARVLMLLPALASAICIAQNTTPSSPAAAGTPALAGPLDRVEDAIEQRDFTRARPLIDTYIAQNKPDARALYDLGFIEQQTGDAAGAERDYRRSIALDSKLPQVHIALGRVLAADHPGDARKEWAATAADTTADARYRAEACRETAALDLELESRKSAPAAAAGGAPAPPSAAADLDAALTPEKAALLEEARAALIVALQLSPETPDDELMIARIAIAQGETADAETALRKLIAAQPANLDAQVELAGLLRAGAKYAEAEAVLRPVHAAEPDNLPVTVMLAGVLAAEAKTQESLDLLKAAHAAHPDNADVTLMLSDVANQHAADPALAGQLLQQMLAKNPDDPELLAEYGAALVRQDRFPEAVVALKRSLATRPDDGGAWGALAFSASKTGDWPLILTALTQRKKYLSENASSYFLWGQAYDRLHRTKEAADNYRQFLALAGGKFPDQEFQVRHRLMAMERNR